MNDLHKVLVVDDGERSLERALSAELAEHGVSSVTTSVEAADDVLQVIPAPAAIFLQMPRRAEPRYAAFVELANRLRRQEAIAAIPIIQVDPATTQQAGGIASILSKELGAQALTETVV